MVGNEWEDTARDVTEVVLPLLAQHRIRFIQIGRADRQVRADGTGVVVFDDSRSPHRLHIEGAYTLGTEMLTAGTQPQVGGSRRCSMSAKGEVLDPVIAAITHGRPYRHVVGFEAGELSRARRDAGYDTALRHGEYPLISWGWDRERVLAYIAEKTGRAWQKSACVFCPFALVTAANRTATLARYAAFPEAGARMLLMEHTALAYVGPNTVHSRVGRCRSWAGECTLLVGTCLCRGSRGRCFGGCLRWRWWTGGWMMRTSRIGCRV
ncbi:hypothetical protein [Nocardia farcinica]|nr:hypothetical protein [Nocardia farcinica]